MSFITDFKTIIEADPSLNALATGGIKMGHLPGDYDIRKDWVVWDYRISDQVNTFGCNNVFSNYSIQIMITSTDTLVLNDMCNLLRNYLNNKTTDKFVDIHFISDSKITTLSRAASSYQNALEFTAIYVS